MAGDPSWDAPLLLCDCPADGVADDEEDDEDDLAVPLEAGASGPGCSRCSLGFGVSSSLAWPDCELP